MIAKPTHFYVYYRIAADTLVARRRIGALMAEIEARTGVAGTLHARCDDASTWMETYAPTAGAATFRRILAAMVKKHDAVALTADGRRHIEQFAALKPLPRRAKADSA